MVLREEGVDFQEFLEVRKVIQNIVSSYLIVFSVLRYLLFDILFDLRVLQLVFGIAFGQIPLEFVNICVNLTLRAVQDEVDDLMQAIAELLVLPE